MTKSLYLAEGGGNNRQKNHYFFLNEKMDLAKMTLYCTTLMKQTTFFKILKPILVV